MNRDELVEVLADVEHERWSHWMRYLFGVSEFHEDGTVTIPGDKARRWNNLAALSYADLDERTKQYDRDEVEKTLQAIQDSGAVVLVPSTGELKEGRVFVPGEYRRGLIDFTTERYVPIEGDAK